VSINRISLFYCPTSPDPVLGQALGGFFSQGLYFIKILIYKS
jgi:hypothetical protein